MILAQRAAAIAFAVLFPVLISDGASAQSLVACHKFTDDVIAAPEPREAAAPLKRFDEIKQWVKAEHYRALYLGDSITQLWDPALWRANMAPRGVLNAGVSGDRSEHLVWRLDHGNLDGPPPKVAIVLIGTNDIGHGRSVEDAAEGIRAVLIKLRVREPTTRILLLGLWPRGATPSDPFRKKVEAVNKLIQSCGDNKTVFYADIGGVLLDARGDLTRAISPDLLHFTAAGYARIAPLLDRLLDPLLAMPNG
ncbi:MAG TPA: GDSL-type esterase/lipase family protein [Stellaceae bacterium]|jgi:lysophospholipase L1-like esterase|nr:GDSL-type esterase/lipase family protein [Stellaceae bacterium]